MPATPNTPQEDTRKTGTATRMPSCPCCAGALIMLRGLFRCTRCQYSLCEGCEVGGEEVERD